MFFSTFAASNFVYRPFFATSRLERDPMSFNRLHAQLYEATRKFTFAPLRNLLINTVVTQLHPTTLQESKVAIKKIETESLGRNPKNKTIEEFPNSEVRDILVGLQRLRVGELRNKVVHQQAYRPRRVEVEECLQGEIAFLYCVKRCLNIGTLDEFSAGLM